MFSTTIVAVATAALAATRVAAHGGVLSYSWGGKWYFGWNPYNSPTGQTSIQRPWSSYNPITDATSPQVACNNDGTAGGQQQTATVAAGTAVTAYWNQVWPHPYGPVMTYLANCGGDCTGVNSNSLSWFKIDEAGLLSGTIANGTWGAGKLVNQNSSWTTTIPSTVPAGNYIIRFETIALHSLPAQIYPECAQITITGNGNVPPTSAQLVKFPGGYKNTDPGMIVNLYANDAASQTSYVIPGPPKYGSSAAGAPPAPAPPAPSNPPANPPAPSNPPPAPTTPAPKPSTPAPAPVPTSGTIAHYGQCGGIGWAGATGCVTPYKCTYSNDYYSQCL